MRCFWFWAICFDLTSALQNSRGEFSFAKDGRHHQILYNVQHAENQSIIDIGNITGMGTVNTTCNLDSSHIVVSFEQAQFAQAFANYIYEVRLLSGTDVFFTASGKQGCPLIQDSDQGFLFRRILGDPVSYQGSATSVIVQTTSATYSDVYSSAQISYSSRPVSGWDLCIGLNADPTNCDIARYPLPMYSGNALSVTCDGCFAGFKADVFFDLQIHDFMLRSLSGGFRDLSVNAGLGVDMQAHAEKPILDLEKSLLKGGGEDHPVISFKIGPVPFAIWFESAIQVNGELTFSAQAEAKAHLAAQYNIGDNYVQWQEGRGWSHIEPHPKLSVTPSVEGTADFGVTGYVSLPSSLAIHVNQVFSHTTTLTPKASLDIHSDSTSRQICIDSGYSASVVASGQLHISILLNLVHADATYGPVTLWSTEDTLPEKCSKLRSVGVEMLV